MVTRRNSNIRRNILSVEDVFRMTLLSPETIRRALRSGELAGVKVGQARQAEWRITRAAVADWLHVDVGSLYSGRHETDTEPAA